MRGDAGAQQAPTTDHPALSAPCAALPPDCAASPAQVAELEADSAALQESLSQKHQAVKGMERRLASYEVEVQELQQKVGSVGGPAARCRACRAQDEGSGAAALAAAPVRRAQR